MRLKFNLKKLAAMLLVASLPLALPVHAAAETVKPAQHAYAAPEDAVKGFVDALRTLDKKVIATAVGPQTGKWLFSGDDVADRAEWQRFIAAYDRKHALSTQSDGRAILLVGDDDWAFPAPLVKGAKGWAFDAVSGREEIINRRIGRNELDTIQTLLAIVDAQREYAMGDFDGNGYNDYAQRFISASGERDGLYWTSAPGERISPLGPLLARAASAGYGKKVGVTEGNPRGTGRTAYHGYHYRMLKAQGKNAPGGALDYMVKGKMIGGFAVLAYPAKYGVSGVMSFMVNHDGEVFEKDLGPATDATAQKISRYNPDASWKKVQ